MKVGRFQAAIVLAGFVAMSLSACVSVGRPIDQVAAGKIEKGKSTRNDVIRLLGSPDQISTAADGSEVFSYHYMRATAKPATFIPIVGAFAGGADVQNQFYIVTLGADGVVKNFYNTRGGTEASRGVSTGSPATIPEVEAGKRPK